MDVVRLVAKMTGRELRFVDEVLSGSHDRGRYLLLRLISKTRQSAVYLAVDRLLARKVVVKVFRNSRGEAVKESRLLARLNHPNIVQVHDWGEHPRANGGIWRYLVLELGELDLAEWIEKEARHWSEIVTLFVAIGRALTYLHAAGHVHQDIKPTNIICVGKVFKIIDFGTVCRPRAKQHEVAGTPGFIAPEVLEHGVSFASDVFSFFVTLWACLHLELPFALPSDPNRDAAAAVSMVLAEERRLTPPRYIPPGMPILLRVLLEDGLHPDPAQRPTMEEATSALQVILDRYKRRQRLRRWAPAIAGGVLVVLGTGFAVGVRMQSGRSSGSLPEVVIGGFDDPLDRAEAAAMMGRANEAVESLYQMDREIDMLSEDESARAANVAKRIAVILEQGGHKADAFRVWFFVIRFYKRAGDWDQVEAARTAQEALISLVPSQNK